jgi:hypothetical protein
VVEKCRAIGVLSRCVRSCTGLRLSDWRGPMPDKGPPPKVQRRRRSAPTRGEWKSTTAVGWQHGALPKPPSGLVPASRTAWWTWFKSWQAAHWIPGDLLGLRIIVRLYDQVERGEYQRSAELRLWLSTYGVTPSGAQDRRWLPSEEDPSLAKPKDYAHLRVLE